MKYTIVIGPFPFGDLAERKMRPLICLTHPTGRYSEVVVGYITTRKPSMLLPSDIMLPLSLADSTHLKYESYIRCHKVFTIPASMLQGQIGMVPPAVQVQIASIMRAYLGT